MQELLEKLPEPMQLNSTMFIIAAIFLLLLIVLNLLIYKPLVSVMEERERRIKEGAEAQRKSLNTVDEKLAAYREALANARREAQSRRQEILKESELGRSEIIGSAKEKAMGMVQAAVTDLEKQVGDAKDSLKSDAEEVAKRVVDSVLARATS